MKANQRDPVSLLPTGDTMLQIHTILHPTDYSDLSGPAFELACSLARDYAAELLICHVAPAPTAVVNGMVIETPVAELAKMTAQLEQVKPEDPRIRVSHKLLRGDPASEILRLAEKIKPDLIVMGTHGRGPIAHMLLGSVAEKTIRKAPCPVLTVRHPQHEFLKP
jgi:nucleotide-binding universal stress UspA family protein